MRALPQQRSQRAVACGLKPDRVAIGGCVGGFSRYVLWMEAHTTNNDPKVTANYFITSIAPLGGRPKWLRTARGTKSQYWQLQRVCELKENIFLCYYSRVWSVVSPVHLTACIAFCRSRQMCWLLHSQKVDFILNIIFQLFFSWSAWWKKLLSFLFPIGGPNNNNSVVSHYCVKLGTLFCSVSQSVTLIRNKW